MGLAIDASGPSTAVQPSDVATVVSGSFTPPSGSLLLPLWSANSQPSINPGAPSITDNLGTPLTYTLNDWKSRADSPAADGQAADWRAPVANSAAQTVTVTNGAAADRQAALRVMVLTGHDPVTPVGAHGKSGSLSAASIAQSFTATRDGSWGFLAVCDWDVTGAMSAGAGTTLIASANIGTSVTYGFFRRTTADGVAGASTTLNATLGGTSGNVSWAWVEVLPAVDAAVPLELPPDLLYELVAAIQQQWANAPDTPVVAAATPAPVVVQAGTTPVTVTGPIVGRASLDNPPVSTTPGPVVVDVAGQATPAVTAPIIGRASLADAVVTPTTTPTPVVVVAAASRSATNPPIVGRASLVDPPGATPTAPVVVWQQPPRIAGTAPVVGRASLADVVVAPASTPPPVVVWQPVAPSSMPRTVVLRSSLADAQPTLPLVVGTPGLRPGVNPPVIGRASLDNPPVLTTPLPIVVLARTPQPRVMVLISAAAVSCVCVTPRPGTGTTTRPGTGTTAWALPTTGRPSTGTTVRPNTGATEDPCC